MAYIGEAGQGGWKMNRGLHSIILIFATLFLGGLSGMTAYAADSTQEVGGRIYTFDEKGHYDYLASKSHEEPKPGVNTYGTLKIKGNIAFEGDEDGTGHYAVNDGRVDILYTYDDKLLSAEDEEWHLIDDRTKDVAGIKLGAEIKKGALILQTSKDGESWVNDRTLTNVFSDIPVQSKSFYQANDIQIANGCYYRLIVAWEQAIKTGQSKGLFGTEVGKTSKYDYKKTAEVYEFYLYNPASKGSANNEMTRNLGTLVSTGMDNGYSGNNKIGITDPHYGWKLGQFFVSGYTRETEKDKNPVFLKNVGDQITLWFNLEQDINRLNDNENLSINGDDMINTSRLRRPTWGGGSSLSGIPTRRA